MSTSWVSMTMSPNVLSDGVGWVPKVGEKSFWWIWPCCDDARVNELGFCIDARGEAAENGEWRLRRRSASETMTGSGFGRALLLKGGGGGMEAWLNGDRVVDDGDAEGCGAGSNLMGGSEMSEAMEGWEFAGGGGFDANIFESRGLLLFSELYITATFVDGEFIVPVRDHPMAMLLLVSINSFTANCNR